jgi:hypothetical protein
MMIEIALGIVLGVILFASLPYTIATAICVAVFGITTVAAIASFAGLSALYEMRHNEKPPTASAQSDAPQAFCLYKGGWYYGAGDDCDLIKTREYADDKEVWRERKPTAQ